MVKRFYKGLIRVALLMALAFSLIYPLTDPLTDQIALAAEKPQAKAPEKSPEKPLAKPAEKPMSARSLAHLYEKMAKEPPLKEADIKIFLAQLPEIMDFGQDPSLMTPVMEISGWTENRLIYAVTKINLGILALFDPENIRLKEAPDFARPSLYELELLRGHQDEISRAMTRLVTRPGRR
jgi:hypothetical protein